MTCETIDSAYRPVVEEETKCTKCKDDMVRQVKTAIVDWTKEKVSCHSFKVLGPDAACAADDLGTKLVVLNICTVREDFGVDSLHTRVIPCR